MYICGRIYLQAKKQRRKQKLTPLNNLKYLRWKLSVNLSALTVNVEKDGTDKNAAGEYVIPVCREVNHVDNVVDNENDEYADCSTECRKT